MAKKRPKMRSYELGERYGSFLYKAFSLGKIKKGIKKLGKVYLK